METEKEKRPDQVCHEVQMWYLDEMSCVYVPRHRIWMEWALERVKGFAASLRGTWREDESRNGRHPEIL